MKIKYKGFRFVELKSGKVRVEAKILPFIPIWYDFAYHNSDLWGTTEFKSIEHAIKWLDFWLENTNGNKIKKIHYV